MVERATQIIMDSEGRKCALLRIICSLLTGVQSTVDCWMRRRRLYFGLYDYMRALPGGMHGVPRSQTMNRLLRVCDFASII